MSEPIGGTFRIHAYGQDIDLAFDATQADIDRAVFEAGLAQIPKGLGADVRFPIPPQPYKITFDPPKDG